MYTCKNPECTHAGRAFPGPGSCEGEVPGPDTCEKPRVPLEDKAAKSLEEIVRALLTQFKGKGTPRRAAEALARAFRAQLGEDLACWIPQAKEDSDAMGHV